MPMQYFFLEKQNTLTQTWKVRQFAFDPKFCYLYYSAPVSRSALEDSSGHLSSKSSVTWRKRLKLKSLVYGADSYGVPPTSPEFEESVLLTMTVTGEERPMDVKASSAAAKRQQKRELAASKEAAAFNNNNNNNNNKTASSRRGGGDDSFVSQPSRNNSSRGAPSVCEDPQLPSNDLHWKDYHFSLPAEDDMEDEDENLFRDIELAPDSDPNDLDDEESEEESEEEEDAVPESPTTRSMEDANMRGGRGARSSLAPLLKPSGKPPVTLYLRARNYDAFRVVSLRLRQGLVRHGRCPPLHRGLPPYDPRSGIALATIPLHLRSQFRRLNDVVFYSFQYGHAVYVRGLREVRGLCGYLCITHDSVLLLQGDGKCPRWLDLEDITGIDYVVDDSHSFVSILAASPMPDFVFIPVFPSYPLCSGFDAEDAVEGVVGMLRRLLMQRLRSQGHTSLPALPRKQRINPNDAMDVKDYDTLCHIRNLTTSYTDVFTYIAQQGAGRPMQWRWANTKTPTHFTYKKDLYEALRREEDDSDASSSDDEAVAVVPKISPARTDMMNMSSHSSAASITTMTVAQLLAPPSKDAELRARERLRLTRADPDRRQPSPQAKPESYGLVHAMPVGDPHLSMLASRGTKLPRPPHAVSSSSSIPTMARASHFDPHPSHSDIDSDDEEDEGTDEDIFDSEGVDDLFEERQQSQLGSPHVHGGNGLHRRMRKVSSLQRRSGAVASSEDDDETPLLPSSTRAVRVTSLNSRRSGSASLKQKHSKGD